MATITANVAGRIFGAPPMPLAARPAPNVEAVAAATMPRGAIHPMKARSFLARSVLSVDAKAVRGPGGKNEDGDETDCRRQHRPSRSRR